MNIQQKTIKTEGVKFFIEQDGKEVARAYFYVLKNDLNAKLFGYLEDVFVDESLRGQGIGTKLINQIIEEAKKHNCYKIVATSRHSRPKVHAFYERLGFENFGIEFKMYL